MTHPQSTPETLYPLLQLVEGGVVWRLGEITHAE